MARTAKTSTSGSPRPGRSRCTRPAIQSPKRHRPRADPAGRTDARRATRGPNPAPRQRPTHTSTHAASLSRRRRRTSLPPVNTRLLTSIVRGAALALAPLGQWTMDIDAVRREASQAGLVEIYHNTTSRTLTTITTRRRCTSCDTSSLHLPRPPSRRSSIARKVNAPKKMHVPSRHGTDLGNDPSLGNPNYGPL